MKYRLLISSSYNLVLSVSCCSKVYEPLLADASCPHFNVQYHYRNPCDVENIDLGFIALKPIVFLLCIGQFERSCNHLVNSLVMLVHHFQGGIEQRKSRHQTVLLVTQVSRKVLYLNSHDVTMCSIILFTAFASPRRRDVGSVFIRTLVTVFYRLAHLHHLEKMAAIVRFLLQLISGIIIRVF